MHSKKSVICTVTAALAISIGLAAFGGTAFADPSYRAQNAWQHQARWQHHNWQNGDWQHHAWQHQRFYHHSRYGYGQYDHGWYGYHHDWRHRHYGNVGYRAPSTRAYYAPSVLSFSINLPLSAGPNGH